mgnify:CR=1 FL=1
MKKKILIGLGIGVSTLVGQYLGENKDDLAARVRRY